MLESVPKVIGSPLQIVTAHQIISEPYVEIVELGSLVNSPFYHLCIGGDFVTD